MGFWASGDDNEGELSSVAAAAKWGPKNEFEADAASKYDAADGYGINQLGKPGMSKAAIAAYYDQSASDPFKSGLRSDVAGLGARTAPTAGTQNLGNVGGRSGYAGTAGIGAMATYGGASLDTGESDEMRARQMAALARLSAQAKGLGPSAGADQAAANLAAVRAGNMSAAASGPKGNAALAARMMANRNAAAGASTSGAVAAIKTQEQMQAQDLYASLAGSMRSADFDAANQNAAFAGEASKFNAGQSNNAKLAAAGFDAQSKMFNATASQKQYEMDQQVALANMEATLRSQGLNDQAIAARMAMLQDQVNRDRMDRMAFWGFASGDRKFDASMQFQKDQDDAARTSARWGAAAQGAAWYASQPNEPAKKA